MWQYKIHSKLLGKNGDLSKMYFVAEDFDGCGHTSYKSAGLLTAESKKGLREMLATMLLDVCKSHQDAEKVIRKMRAKYTKVDNGNSGTITVCDKTST